MVFILIVSYFISRALTSPIKKLSKHARLLAKGNMDVEIDIVRKDEIGILALSFRKMQHSVKRLIEDLREINHNLEDRVKERTHEIHLQKEMVEEKNKEIVDSINYAKRLQSAIIPPENKVLDVFNDCFVLFKPKDIVSGDFYWLESFASHSEASDSEGNIVSHGEASDSEGTVSKDASDKGKLIMFAVADCTGHGVPGAMVSVVGANSLNRCVKEFGLKKPGEILDKLRQLIVSTFENANHEVKDGMDISLFTLDTSTVKLEWAGANNPLWILRKDADEIEEIKADKQPIGKFDHGKPFTTHTFNLQKGDCIYIFSDGYADQFGGEKGKKFKASTMKELFISMHGEPMQKQKNVLDAAFEKWKGNLEQIDDVCVMGIKI
jgi:serine phosphatase RsbU (regulator of sigma subunit)